MSKPTVVLHIDALGNVEVFADGEVDVIWVSDLAPNDRCYRATPEPIPAGLIDEEVGHQGDGSPAAAKLSKFIKEAYGLPAFEVIK